MTTLFDDLGESGDDYFDDLSTPPPTSTAPIISSLSGVVRYLGSVTITGSNFGASRGTGGVTIGGVSQTITAWSDTSITLTPIARGMLKYGSQPLVVLSNAGEVNAAYPITLLPQAGWDYVTLVAPLATSGQRLTSIPDLIASDMVAYGNVIPLGAVTVNADGTFLTDRTVGEFSVEVNDGTGWGGYGVETMASVLFDGTLIAGSASASGSFTVSGGPAGIDQFNGSIAAGNAAASGAFSVFTSIAFGGSIQAYAATVNGSFSVTGAVTQPTIVTPSSTPATGTAASRVQIANMMAVKLGASSIRSFKDQSKVARSVALVYDRILDLELSRHWWRFAICRKSMPEVISDEPRGPFHYSYGKPSDWLTTLFFGPPGAWPGVLSILDPSAELPEWSHEGVYIHSNQAAPAELVYLRRITDPTKYHATFVEAFACRLAMETCDAITGSMSRWNALAIQYNASIAEARRLNAIMEPPKRVYDDGSWLNSRN